MNVLVETLARSGLLKKDLDYQLLRRLIPVRTM